MDIKENLTKFTEKIPSNVQLIAVSKTRTIEEWKRPMNLVLENLVKIRFKK